MWGFGRLVLAAAAGIGAGLTLTLSLRLNLRRRREAKPPPPLPPGYPVTLSKVREAYARVKGLVHRTPVLTSSYLDGLLDPAPRESGTPSKRLYFKCEAFQRTGSFKVRGATNAALLTPEGAVLVTHSSGNHAQAIALAARETGRAAHIVMPRNAPEVKRAAVVGYGAEVTLCEPTNAARAAEAERVRVAVGGYFVHPSNDPEVIAGQGTLGLEFLEQVPHLDCIVVPIGGGGMISGVAVAAKTLNPKIRIVAAEPENARDAATSKKAGEMSGHLPGQPATVADGLKTVLGSNTWPVVEHLVDAVITVSEVSIRVRVKALG